MKRRTLLLIIVPLHFFWFTGLAQPRILTIETDRKEDQSVDFNYSKDAYGSFLVTIDFKKLENAYEMPFRKVVKSSIGKLFTIKPISEKNGISFSYNYWYIRGIPNPEIDSAFVYLLPLSQGKCVRVSHHKNIYEKYFGETPPKNWKSFHFSVSEGDTVFSARRGIVVEVVDEYDPDSTQAYSFTPKSNSIMVEHPDGTLAKYSVLKRGSLMVEPGQQVFAHQPLALAGTYDKPENTHLRFFIKYLCEDHFEAKATLNEKKRKQYYAFIDPVFCTQDGNIRLKNNSIVTAEIREPYLLQELTKRERKKMSR